MTSEGEARRAITADSCRTCPVRTRRASSPAWPRRDPDLACPPARSRMSTPRRVRSPPVRDFPTRSASRATPSGERASYGRRTTAPTVKLQTETSVHCHCCLRWMGEVVSDSLRPQNVQLILNDADSNEMSSTRNQQQWNATAPWRRPLDYSCVRGGATCRRAPNQHPHDRCSSGPIISNWRARTRLLHQLKRAFLLRPPSGTNVLPSSRLYACDHLARVRGSAQLPLSSPRLKVTHLEPAKGVLT